MGRTLRQFNRCSLLVFPFFVRRGAVVAFRLCLGVHFRKLGSELGKMFGKMPSTRLLVCIFSNFE